MIRRILCGAAVLLAGSVIAVAADHKDEVQGAAKKLAEAQNYSWTTTIEAGGGGGNFRPGPTEGKTEKDGLTWLSMSFGDNTTEAFVKGGKGVIKTEDGWQTLEEAAQDDGGGQQNPRRFMARRVQNLKTPAQQVEESLGKLQDCKQDGDAYEAQLSEEGAKELLRLGRRGGGGGNGPEISNAKATVKVWVKDGMLAKYAAHVSGTVSTPNGDREIDRTTTTEIKNVGSTKIDVPEDAKKKMP
jgi:hypothetical protein